jgi:chromosome segregation ATPase
MKRFFLVLVVMALTAAAFAVDGFAQTKRKKQSGSQPRRAIPVSTQQIIEQTEPEIITQSQQIPSSDEQQQPSPVNDSQQLSDAATIGATSESFQEKIDQFNARIKEMNSRLGSLESSRRGELDEKQRKLLLNLEILSRAEQRAETLREKLFSLTEKENSLKSDLEQIEYESQDEVLNRGIAVMGSMRPEELREQRRRSLQNKKTNMNNLLQQIQTTKRALEDNVVKADQLVEKLRVKLETDIDNALNDIEPK